MSVLLNDAEAKMAVDCLRLAESGADTAVVAAKLRHGLRDLTVDEADLVMKSLDVSRQGNEAYFHAHDVTLTTLWRKLETR